MSAARNIQMGMLPHAVELPTDAGFDLHAVLEPAKAVGGDLFDFFLLDERRLFFLIGDVSDKGVPAALFMAVTKTLFSVEAKRDSTSVSGIMAPVSYTHLDVYKRQTLDRAFAYTVPVSRRGFSGHRGQVRN